MRSAAIALAVAIAAAACAKKADKPPPPGPGSDRPPPITREEITRNDDACKAYATQVCACAKAHPDKADVVELCNYDTALPGALELAMATAMNPESSRNDVLLSQSAARKIATQCLDSLARLPALGCGQLEPR